MLLLAQAAPPPSMFERWLPPLLLQSGPRDMLLWQWIALPLVFAAAWLAGMVLGRITRAVASRLAARTSVTWDDLLVERLGAPATLAWTVVVAEPLVALLSLTASAQLFFDRVLHAALFVAFFWALVRGVDVAHRAVAQSAWARTYPQSRSLIPLAARVGKVGVIAMSVVAVLADLGYPVASLIAGLGIGGLAVALAAQKTLENLFGAFTIGVDQPFREGDYIQAEGFSGTVEEIGLRSTRVRTVDRTVITVPNGKLAEMRVETFAPRDRIKLALRLGLERSATAAQVRSVVSGVEAALRTEPKLFGDPSVRFIEIGESALTVDVFAMIDTPDWNEFQRIREELLLAFLRTVESSGARLAYPTRTIDLRSPRAAE